jgi:hypothetical protein
MVERGVLDGVILNVRRTRAGLIMFEINFGRAGQPKHCEFSRRAFYLPSNNGTSPSAPGATS